MLIQLRLGCDNNTEFSYDCKRLVLVLLCKSKAAWEVEISKISQAAAGLLAGVRCAPSTPTTTHAPVQLALQDGRVVFMLPFQGHIIAGTTDAPCGVISRPTASADEVRFILEAISDFLAIKVGCQLACVCCACARLWLFLQLFL